MQKPLVSIIVPTLNEEKFIGQCLKALLSQSIPKEKYEIIVSDSSSADKTVEIAKKYADNVVVCEKRGAGFGRNFGAKQAKGNFFGFVDADTIVSKKWVEGLIDGLEKGIACTGPISSLEKDSIKLRFFYKWWSLQSRFSTIFGYPIFPGFSIGIRKNIFEKVKGFSTENITTEDIELGMKIRELGKIVFVQKMKVKTSSRRFKELSIPAYVWNGITFTLFGKSRKWQEHRKDF